jgi:hypothetical protein
MGFNPAKPVLDNAIAMGIGCGLMKRFILFIIIK